MTTHNQLENAFGKIEKSQWQTNAETRQKERSWKNYSQQIALEILEHLHVIGMSQKTFASQMNVSPQIVNKWLKGGENFTLETICKLEAALDLTLIAVQEKTEKSNHFETPVFVQTAAYKKPNSSNQPFQMTGMIVNMYSKYPSAKTSLAK